ncbi:MAG: ABC transporter ATP-binding protein [Clostridia bacterium]|nr:ABC transporter ATP-binding protein [Clostridia bacterium]
MMILIENLNKSFGPFKALTNINLQVEKGEIYGFLGHNGAGKTTTINILTGLSRPDSGKCIVNGFDLSKNYHPGDLNIGYLPEEPSFYPWMTGFETLKYLYESIDKKDKSRVEEVIEMVGLKEDCKRRVGGYSRGMKQRLGMGAALIGNPKLLLLDEPSSALDPSGRSDVLKLIMALKEQGKTIFLSTHILSDVERVCTRVSILKKGEVVLEKSMKQLMNDNVVPVYDIEKKGIFSEKEMQMIKVIDGIKKVTLENDLLSVWVDSLSGTNAKLMKFFSDNKIEIESFVRRTRKLEDIFLKEVG